MSSSASDQAGFQSTTTVITSTTTTTAITKPSIPSHPTIASSASVFSRMSLEDVLEDLASRFILNLPPVELSQIERVCFQVEQAHWFYEDFVRPNSSLRLPSYNLKTFTRLFFEKCEFLRTEGAPLSGWDPQAAYDKFLRYKERVPVCGAIILNSDASKVLLVKGYKANSSWSFPRGKINENEQPRDCAIREVLEETGFDITPHMCLSSTWGLDSKLSAIQKGRPSNPTPSGPNNTSHRHSKHCMLHSEGDDHFIEIMIREQKLRMYLVTGIPDETIFETQTRQEISAIAWFPLADLPTFTSEAFSPKRPSSNWTNIPPQHLTEPDIHGFRASAKFYMVVPFVSDLRTWLLRHNLLCASDYGLPMSFKPDQHPQHPPHMILNEINAMAAAQSRYAHYPGANNFEAAAVYERARRLQTFQFDEEIVPSPPPPPEARLTQAAKKKKKKNNRKKDNDQPKQDPHLHADVYIDDQPQSNTEDEIEANVEVPWNDLDEGTRALQKLFFGDSKPSEAAEEPNGKPIQFLTYNERHQQQNQLASDADTDVVKGYDIATSYASSMSSSYRDSSTQMPSSDEHNAQSTNLLSQLLNSHNGLDPVQQTDNDRSAPYPITRMNEAEAMYSKHGHLAAPRPQPAPQQVERLLAMLQAPTPGPLSSIGRHSHLPEMSLAGALNHTIPQLHLDMCQFGSDGDLEQNTPRHRGNPVYEPPSHVVGGYSSGPDIHMTSPGSGGTSVPLNFSNSRTFQPTQPAHAFSSPVIYSSPIVGVNQFNGTTSAEPITPRASNLLDLLIKGNAKTSTGITGDTSSLPTTQAVPQVLHQARLPAGRVTAPHHHGFASHPTPPTVINSLLSSPSSHLPLKEAERREKQDALLRQLQSLANFGLQHPSQPTIAID